MAKLAFLVPALVVGYVVYRIVEMFLSLSAHVVNVGL